MHRRQSKPRLESISGTSPGSNCTRALPLQSLRATLLSQGVNHVPDELCTSLTALRVHDMIYPLGVSPFIITNNSPCCQVQTMKIVQCGRIRELEEKIAELKVSLPRHSLPASRSMEPAEMEDESMQLQAWETSDEPRDLAFNDA